MAFVESGYFVIGFEQHCQAWQMVAITLWLSLSVVAWPKLPLEVTVH